MGKIGILHLSDLHIESDNYLNKVDAIAKSCRFDINQVSCLYIVITGDIVKHGRTDEYDKAKEFISTLQKEIKPANSILQIKIFLVPGNHDCCFDNVKTTRNTILDNCVKDVIKEKDFFDDALVVQDNFWNFYKDIRARIPEDKISYAIEDLTYLNNKIIFHCYNSSWMSKREEKYGEIVIPENKFLENENENGNITISIFHHPLSWLSPNTENNNKKRFEDHLIKSSDLVLYGHEHDKGQVKHIQQKNNNVIFSEGKAFQKDTPEDTGFSYFEIDLSSKNIICKVYSLKVNNYIVESEDKFTLQKKEKRVFSLTDEFATKINTLKIPLKHSRKENLEISDVFIFPDLEPIKDDNLIQDTDSKDLLDKIKKEENQKIVIEGDDQSGKTTLMFSYYRNLYNSGFLPIYIRGKYVNATEIKAVVKKALKEQYDNNNIDLFFQQHKRVLLFDNLQSTRLNPKYRASLLKNLDKQFDYTIITTSNSTISNLAVEEFNVLKGYDKYRLLPLGYEKRGELIDQWLRIGENKMTIREEEISKSLKLRINEVNSLIGNRLMPSYPIFILTILQGLDTQIFQDFSQTSYAHCYHALITAGLVKEGLKEHLNDYFNLLKDLSFFLFENKKEYFNLSDFDLFFAKFKGTYFTIHSSDQILKNLANANILKIDDDGYYIFSYKYIFYFLVAQKIAEDIDKYNDLIYDLCNNIHLEKNANILIFLTHHTKAQILLEHIIFASNLPFEKVAPITLETTDPFSSFIAQFIQEIQGDMVHIEERNPNEELKKEQQEKDKLERKQTNGSTKENDYEMPQEVIEINQALQTIKILGQIVKNQSGSFEKNKLIELTETAYHSTFRLINFFAEIFKSEKESIIDAICDDLKERKKVDITFGDSIRKVDREEIKKRTTKFLQFMSYGICIDGFTNLILSVGAQGREELYDAVSKKIGSSAAKIVTFAIKSYYGSINIRDLEKLFQEVEDNYIAKNILRFYVKKHIYTNCIERTKKEKIIQIAGFKSNIITRRR